MAPCRAVLLVVWCAAFLAAESIAECVLDQYHKPFCGGGCKKEERDDADSAVWGAPYKNLDRSAWASTKRKLEHTHTPFGLPTASRDFQDVQQRIKVLYFDDLIVGYDTFFKVPHWAAYQMNPAKDSERIDCFRRDQRLEDEESQFCCEYQQSHNGFDVDRGHVAPSNDMKAGKIAQMNCCFLTNMTPQYAGFNRGMWQRLELKMTAKMRKANLPGKFWMITGTAFDYDDDGEMDRDDHIDEHRMIAGGSVVPSHYYKLAVYQDAEGGGLQTLSVVLKHEGERLKSAQSDPKIAQGVTPLSVLEKLTGFSFLPHEHHTEELAGEVSVADVNRWPAM